MSEKVQGKGNVASSDSFILWADKWNAFLFIEFQ